MISSLSLNKSPNTTAYDTEYIEYFAIILALHRAIKQKKQ